ncbi:hypothetical protein [Aliidiomarina quisquiliarum]|uniref:hypothetical protein n=1 Tax=Aliidiomarina quisquiliarum TaxID=2938947 RepID=UPI00208F6576|nr:hypothetical protein [Aliidiomarina quisquiliarum]
MNEAGNLNKYTNQMLALRCHLFRALHSLFFLLLLLLLFFSIIGCTPANDNVEQIKLGDWAVNDAHFSSSGTLALSVSQDIGIYNLKGELLHLLTLPEPNGIWQISWQGNNNLWFYDQHNLYHWRLGKANISPPQLFQANPIRHVRATDHGLMLATETGSVYWYPTNQEYKLQPPRSLLENQVGISTIGFTQQQPYVGTRNGDLWLWEDTTYDTVRHFKVAQPIHAVITVSNQLYALTSRYNNPLATNNELSLWQLSSESTPQAYKLAGSTGVFSHLAVNNAVIVGGSNSSWQSYNLSTHQQKNGALPARNPNQQGRIVALYELPTVIVMLTSRGEMQKWQKVGILGNSQ